MLDPERQQARDYYRQHISQYVARLVTPPAVEHPMLPIGYDESEQDS